MFQQLLFTVNLHISLTAPRHELAHTIIFLLLYVLSPFSENSVILFLCMCMSYALVHVSHSATQFFLCILYTFFLHFSVFQSHQIVFFCAFPRFSNCSSCFLRIGMFFSLASFDFIVFESFCNFLCASVGSYAPVFFCAFPRFSNCSSCFLRIGMFFSSASFLFIIFESFCNFFCASVGSYAPVHSFPTETRSFCTFTLFLNCSTCFLCIGTFSLLLHCIRKLVPFLFFLRLFLRLCMFFRFLLIFSNFCKFFTQLQHHRKLV